MRRSILALAFVLGAATLGAQGQPSGMLRGPGPGPGPDDWGRNFFPPELVMGHQSEIGLQDSQRAALTSAIQQAQSKFTDMQWKLSAEGEKMGRLLQGTQVDEAAGPRRGRPHSQHGARDQEGADLTDGAHQEHAHGRAAEKAGGYTEPDGLGDD